jgi:hypothetical protein
MFRTALLFGALACLSQDPVRVGFDVLASYTWQPGMKLPAEITKLDEKIVIVSGFMQREVPGGAPVNQFLLINDACGCNGTPKLNEIVFCTLPEGTTMNIAPGIVTVTGRLYVGEAVEDGEVVMIYQMDADTVR